MSIFGSKAKVPDQHQLASGALQRIAAHVGVQDAVASPDSLADAICARIDDLVGQGAKAREIAMPGSEMRVIGHDVSRIKLAGMIDLVIFRGDEPKLEVFANDAADLPKILTSVSSGCLVVDNEPMTVVIGNSTSQIAAFGVARKYDGAKVGAIHKRGGTSIQQIFNGQIGRLIGADLTDHAVRTGPLGLRVEVTLPVVKSISASGAGDVLWLGIDQDELELDVSGAGTIEASGRVARLDASISGAGDIHAYRLNASHCRLTVSGVGDLKATATESVAARVSGVGTIKINGAPKERDTYVSGLGKIKFVDGKG